MHDHSSGWLPDRLTCRDFTGGVSEFLDHRLRLWTELRLWMHLTRCPDCRAYAAHLRLLRRTLPLIPLPALPLQTRLRLRQEFLDARLRASGGREL